MDEKKCKNCIYFKQPFSGSVAGHCHRYPPSYANSFPKVVSDNWCGEFKSEKLIQELGDLIMKAFAGDNGEQDE